jgi:mannose-binding lectin 1
MFILKHEIRYVMSVLLAADDHDVLHFLTTSLHAPGQAAVTGGGVYVSDEEQRKLSQEYADYQRKLEQQKEEYVTEYCVVIDT